jgi:Peptidase family M23
MMETCVPKRWVRPEISLAALRSVGFGVATLLLASCQTALSRPEPVQIIQEPVLSWEPREVADGGLLRLEVLVPSEFLKKLGDKDRSRITARARGPKGGFVLYRSPVSLPEGVRLEGLMGIPFGQKPGSLEVPVRLEWGKRHLDLKAVIAVVPGPYLSETLSVDPRHVNPGKEAIRRIQKESSEVGRLYRNSEPSMLWSGVFETPLGTPITSPFGTKRIYNGEMQSFHQGMDFKAPTGTPILAPAGGKVVLAKELYMTGNTVILDHGHGLLTVYAHLSEFKVSHGSTVKKGDLLGLSGATGRASGPHLHWGAIVHRTKVNPIDLTRLVR